MSDQDRPAPKRRSCSQTCGIGCVGTFVLGALVFAVTFSMTGRYKPRIEPPITPPAINGFYDFSAASQTFAANGGTKAAYAKVGRSQGDLDLASEQKLVAANLAALAQLRTGIGKEARVPSERSFTALLPYLGQGRDLARLLSAEARVRAAQGNPARAIDSVLDGYEMGQGITNGGVFIHGLVLVAIDSILKQQFITNVEKLNELECARIAKRMQRILLRQPQPSEIIREARNSTLTALCNIEDLQQLGYMPQSEDADDRSNPASVPVRKIFGGAAWHLMRDLTLKELDRFYAATEAELKKPGARRKPVPEPTSTFARMLAPVYMGRMERFDANEVSNRIILCAIAIRGFRLRHGMLPPSLDVIGIDLRLLVDPFTGQPFIYKPAGKDYLLYSIGPDGKDDGGTPAETFKEPIVGDLGMQPFMKPDKQRPWNRWYRRVPHMKPPVLPANAPPLKE